MKLEFKPEDFRGFVIDSEAIAFRANAKLDKYIMEHGKVVYGKATRWNPGPTDNWAWEYIVGSHHTTTAILINIEEISPLKSKEPHLEEFVNEMKHRMDLEFKAMAARLNKIKCEHPKEKVQWNANSVGHETLFICECGARLEPIEFRSVE